MVGKHFLVYNKAVHITNQSIRSMSLEGSLGGNFTSDYKPYSFWIHDHVSDTLTHPLRFLHKGQVRIMFFHNDLHHVYMKMEKKTKGNQ